MNRRAILFNKINFELPRISKIVEVRVKPRIQFSLQSFCDNHILEEIPE